MKKPPLWIWKNAYNEANFSIPTFHIAKSIEWYQMN